MRRKQLRCPVSVLIVYVYSCESAAFVQSKTEKQLPLSGWTFSLLFVFSEARRVRWLSDADSRHVLLKSRSCSLIFHLKFRFPVIKFIYLSAELHLSTHSFKAPCSIPRIPQLPVQIFEASRWRHWKLQIVRSAVTLTTEHNQMR